MTKHSFAPKPPSQPEEHYPISGLIAKIGEQLNLDDFQLDAIEMELEAVFGEGMYELWNSCPNAYAPSLAFRQANIDIVVGQCAECRKAGLIGYRCGDDVLQVEYNHPRSKQRVCKQILC